MPALLLFSSPLYPPVHKAFFRFLQRLGPTLVLGATGLLGGGAPAQAQQELYVDQFTGTAHMGIPLANAGISGANVAVGLDYTASGVKIDDAGGVAGLNWSITGLPTISRVVRGLPDEISTTVAGYGSRTGWLMGNPGNAVPSRITPILNNAPAGDILASLNDLSGNSPAPDMYDSEPDIFTYSLPGHAGKFVFDTQGVVRTIPYDPVIITRESIVSNGHTLPIGAFIIVTPEGTTYRFSDCDFTVRKNILPLADPDFLLPRPWPLFFKKEYDYFKQPNGLTYATTWHATTIVNGLGELIEFGYEPTQYVEGGVARQTAYHLNLNIYPQFLWEYSYQQVRINRIIAPTVQLDFVYYDQGAFIGSHATLSTLRVTSRLVVTDNILKTYSFRYHKTQARLPTGQEDWGSDHNTTVAEGEDEKRYFLVALDVEDHCATVPGYHFTYQGVSPSSNVCAGLGPPDCGNQDYWGFSKPNPTQYGPIVPSLYSYPYPQLDPLVTPGAPYRLFPLNGSSAPSGNADFRPLATQAAFEAAPLQGTLTKVDFPAGGYATLSYEPKWFYDSVASQSFAGGGTRIREIRLRDAFTGAEQIRTYTYQEADATSRSSGRLLRMPRFAILGPSAGGTSAYTSADDLNTDPMEGRDLGYRRVIETVSGRGRTVSTFALSATADAVQAGANGQWQRSLVQFVQSASSSLSPAPCRAGYDVYPFPPAANYDYLQGRPLIVSQEVGPDANGAYAPVQQTQYGYKLTMPGQRVAGVAYDVLGWDPDNTSNIVYAYAPYRLLTDFAFTVIKETNVSPDQTVPARTLTRITEYGYNVRGELASVVKRDGASTAYRTRYKYTADYAYPSATTPMGPILSAQYRRQSIAEGYRPNDVVETISETVTPGGNRSVVGVVWNTFKPDGYSSFTRPYQTWSWQAAPGVPAGTPGAAFETDSVTVQASGGISELRRSARFRLEASIEEMAPNQTPLSVETRAGRQRHGVHLGYGQTVPVLQIDNAAASEVIFSNFETLSSADEQQAFQLVGGGSVSNQKVRTGRGSVALAGAGQYLQTALPGTPTSALGLAVVPAAFRLVFWALPTTATQTATVTLLNSDNSTAWTYSVSLGTATDWAQHEVVVNVGLATGPRTACHLRVGPGTGPGTIFLDDVLFLPSTATAASTTFNPTVGKTSQTDVRGRTTYYDYDQAGQLRQVRNHNRHAVQRTELAPGGVLPPEAPQGVITCDESVYSGQAASFTVSSLCAATALGFAWNFNDGTPLVLSDGPSVSHVFPASATTQSRVVTVTLTLALQPETPRSINKTIEVQKVPFTVVVCKTGVFRFDRCRHQPDSQGDDCHDNALEAASGHTLYRASVPAVYQNNVTYAWHKTGQAATVPPISIDPILDINSQLGQDESFGSVQQYYCLVTHTSSGLGVSSPGIGILFYNNTTTGACPSGNRTK